MTEFKDKHGDLWPLEIKTVDVERVRRLVKDKDGKPVDLLAMTERADFSPIKHGVETLVETIAVLCFDELNQRFNVERYDLDHAADYEVIPEWRDEPRMKKALRWMGERLCGDELVDAVEAMIDAMINFIPSLHRREAMRKINEAEIALEKTQCKKIAEQIAESAQKIPDILDKALAREADRALAEMEKSLENPGKTRK